MPLSNASSATSRPPSHGWGPGWLAMPSLYDSFIRDSKPVYPGAIQSFTLCQPAVHVVKVVARRVAVGAGIVLVPVAVHVSGADMLLFGASTLRCKGAHTSPQKEAVKKSSCKGGPCGRPARAGGTIPRLRDPYDAAAKRNSFTALNRRGVCATCPLRKRGRNGFTCSRLAGSRIRRSRLRPAGLPPLTFDWLPVERAITGQVPFSFRDHARLILALPMYAPPDAPRESAKRVT